MPRLTAILAGSAVVAAAQVTPKYPSESEMDKMYELYQLKHMKADNSATRFTAFKANVKAAIDLNVEQNIDCQDLFNDPKCVFGITKFSDMFQDEFDSTHLGYKRSEQRPEAPVIDLEELKMALKDAPDSVDWRKQGAVSAVKDQGSCGSCWAFSATEEIESAVFMATKKLLDLSTQQIISCDKQDLGCNGGDTSTAYKYVEKAGGIDSASDYPDKSHKTGKSGKCVKHSEVDAKVTGWAYAVKPCTTGQCKDADEAGLATALATKGPISICVNAGGNGWQNYKSGIYSKKCSGAASQLDHCVQLVGYDKTGDTPYWIVRNSWNTDWGIDGYMHLEMGKNLCGIADEATVVTATPAVQTVTV
jgi:C1A family cysteine protease